VEWVWKRRSPCYKWRGCEAVTVEARGGLSDVVICTWSLINQGETQIPNLVKIQGEYCFAVRLLTTRNAYYSVCDEANKLVFYSFFKTLVDQEVTVELKNDLAIKGILKSVDQFLNIKLDDITVLEENKYPHLVNSLTPTVLTSKRLQ
jgi:small nuclear ribonucleoprotein (snRNP)-like protein